VLSMDWGQSQVWACFVLNLTFLFLKKKKTRLQFVTKRHTFLVLSMDWGRSQLKAYLTTLSFKFQTVFFLHELTKKKWNSFWNGVILCSNYIFKLIFLALVWYHSVKNIFLKKYYFNIFFLLLIFLNYFNMLILKISFLKNIF